ncbi:MAG: hypothetical protein N4A33_06155 [Bacteriovoracaceae bacterium]|jgi:hypothetical protein|nr:hypothetical protein [Bacteriovoracaceae bacterium]
MIKILLLLTPIITFANIDSEFKTIDLELGKGGDIYSTTEDGNRFSAYIGSSYEMQFADRLEFDFQYMNRIDSSQFWFSMQFKSLSTAYDQIAKERSTLNADTNSDANITRTNNEQAITMLGAGFSHRFKMLQEITKSPRIFETLSFFFNYVLSTDSTNDRKYKGYGISCDYGIHKRAGKSFFYGGKLSYNIASVHREAIADEIEKNRSLIYGWTNIGLELGYFF